MNMFNKFLRHLAISIVALTMLGPLRAIAADCSLVAATPASFGSVTSFNVASQPQSTSTTNVGMTCPGAFLGLISLGNRISGTVMSANGLKLVSSTGDSIPYSLYQDSSYSKQITLGTTYDWYSTQWISIGGSASSSSALPLYFRTAPGSNVAAGTYTDTLTINWDWHVCTGIAILICLGWSNGSGSTVVPVTLTVTNDCVIVAPNVNFGSAPSVGSFQAVTGNLSLTCTKGMVYTVGLSPGANPAANGRRQMANGTNRLQYDIYSSGGSTVWGQATNRVGSGTAANGQAAQQFPYTAKIYTDQSTPAVGTYTDSVIIDVRY
ncbi:Csu type fimbrial protein [Burkholderia singularis]|uniref:Sigma-fimbriae tip adhesin n=1 Tax=Burkholderia singularis TaxID=1503053 RepID=A0A238H3A6_9BURK|nr:Sigma-fimbriae tip adhesin [Burkholderia singularis]